MNHIMQVPVKERSLVTGDSTSAQSRSLRPEQKGFACMKDVFRNFTSHGQTVIDLCASTFETAKSCMLALRHLGLAGCKVDTMGFKWINTRGSGGDGENNPR